MHGHERQNSRSYSAAQLKYAFDESKIKRAPDGKFGEKSGEKKGKEDKGKPKGLTAKEIASEEKEINKELNSIEAGLKGETDEVLLEDLRGDKERLLERISELAEMGEAGKSEKKGKKEQALQREIDAVNDAHETGEITENEFDAQIFELEKEMEDAKEQGKKGKKKVNKQSSTTPKTIGHERPNARSYSMEQLAYFDEGKVKRAKDGRFGEKPGEQKGEERPSDEPKAKADKPKGIPKSGEWPAGAYKVAVADHGSRRLEIRTPEGTFSLLGVAPERMDQIIAASEQGDNDQIRFLMNLSGTFSDIEKKKK